MEHTVRTFDIFQDLDDSEFAVLRKYFTSQSYSQGEAVSCERTLCIVSEGSISALTHNPQHGAPKQQECRPGDIFGEISLCTGKMTGDYRVSSAVASLLTISDDYIKAMIVEEPAAAVKFVSRLLSLTIKRLRGVSRFLSDIVQWGENASRRVITDELTGVYNRLFLDDVLQSFFDISKSNNKPLALFMLDIDNCRVINENFGMDTGNTILLAVVSIIKNSVSRHGIIARYGGDEFSILLPETDLKGAKKIAEEIRATIASHDFSALMDKKTVPVTISIGISVFPDTATDIASFKEKADESLYEAKRLGRNRVASIL